MQIRFLFGGEYNSDESKIYPTIIDEPNINSEVMRKVKFFGPILPIFSFEKVSEIDKIILSKFQIHLHSMFSDDKEFVKILSADTDLVVELLMIPLFT